MASNAERPAEGADDPKLQPQESEQDQFAIPALASSQDRRYRTLKHDDTFAVFDHNGDAVSGPSSPEGIFDRDTRHLSQLVLALNGARPMLLSSTLREDNAALICDLANPDLVDHDGNVVLAHDLIHVRRTRFLWRGTCYERMLVRNYDSRPQRISLEVHFAADFADIFEVRGARRARRGEFRRPSVELDRVTLGYLGLDGRERTTRLRFEPSPRRTGASCVIFVFELAPHESQCAFLEVSCDEERVERRAVRRAFFSSLRESRRALRALTAEAAGIETSNEIFNEATRRSIADIYMLTTATAQGPLPYAGIPWFSTIFGRDALITAMEMLWLDPGVARGVLGALANLQATAQDDAADAEPGKIMHECRQGEMAELGEVPFKRYYGSVDSTPLFVMLAGAYLDRTDDLGTIRELWPNLQAALGWIEQSGDRDGDGFVEYGRRTSEGLVNQGWKDSHDSVFHADGTLAHGPVALAEVQAYVYGAWRSAASICRRLGQDGRAIDLTRRADDLARRFDATFFDESLGTYVLALDGDKRPCRVRSSNAGHALWTGIALRERVPRLVETLMTRSSFCGWGVRTIPSTEARFNPMSYHNGSVWPHDNALIAAGLARYGERQAAARIFEGLFAASIYVDLRRLPELFCGFPQLRGESPTFYPVACTPQAWAAAAPIYLLQSCLGLTFDSAARQVTFEEPVLPAFLDEVVLRRLAIGSDRVDVALRRSRSQVVVDVLERHGSVRVITRT
jgi:glycogen debranching enzyme